MRRPVFDFLHVYFFSKFHILIWVMVRVVMRFLSSALIHKKNNSNTS